MSASPSGLSNGQTPTPNSGPPRPLMRGKAHPNDNNTLVARKKRPERRKLGDPPSKPSANGQRRLTPVRQAAPLPGAHQIPQSNGGFPESQPTEYQDFPLYTTKRALMEGIRLHVARFASKHPVDPNDQNEFMRPIALHRRDPRQPVGKDAQDVVMEDAIVDSKEQERLDILKSEKEAQRAADLAQIAPTGKGPAPAAAKKNQAFRNEKTTQVFRVDKTEEEKKESDLRYEEALPWHLEDADYKNIWVGSYEAALSDTNVIFVSDGASFKMIPAEKWYKFTRKGQYKTLTIEEAEARLSKKTKEPRWVMQTQEVKKAQEELKQTGRFFQQGNLFTVKSESKAASKSELQDADNLDFNEEDLFQDDDEAPNMVPDEDLDEKESKDRIKREQLAANVFDQANEADVDEEEREEQKMKERLKEEGKKLKKALAKREKMTIYDEDSDSDPYAEKESESDTSDDEKQAEIDRKKDEEAKNKAKAESKLPSGASSKGTNTPSGRSKHVDALKRSNKRSGSPNISESSGNESSRKKKKMKHSSRPTGKGTSTPGSRSMSPVPSSSAPAPGQTPRKSSIVKLSVNSTKLSDIQSVVPNPSPTNASQMSDGEATGGETSDGGSKRKKIKLRIGGASGANSRAGSPVPGKHHCYDLAGEIASGLGILAFRVNANLYLGRAGSIAANGSRAGSPNVASAPSKLYLSI